MLRHCKVVLFGLFIATFTAAVASATTYTITSLLPAGDTTSEAIGIDQSGDVVGQCTTAAGKLHGMLYTGGVAMDMGNVPQFSPPAGAGGGTITINSTVFNGVAVSASTGDLLIAGTVNYSWSLGPPSNTIPFILDYNPTTQAKTWTVMPSQYNGGVYSYNSGAGWGINANGQVIGDNSAAGQNITPFTSTLAGTQTNIANISPMLSNGSVGGSTFWGIDSAGDAAGRAPTTASGTGGDDLVLYIAATNSVVDFGSPNTGGIDCGIYRSGNNIYVTGEEFNPTQDAVWTYNTLTSTYTVNGLGVLGQAYGINGSLTEVGLNGVVYNATTPGATQTLIYQNSVVPGITTSGWANSSYYLRGINDAGAIAGYGTYNGSTTALLLTPVPTPEPSSLALAAAGVFGLLAYAWRKRK
jgi:hypothetical protein